MYQVLTQLCWNCCAIYDIGPCRPKFSCIISMCCDYIYDVSWLSPIVVVLIHDVVIHVVATHVVVVFVLVVVIYIHGVVVCIYLFIFLVDDHYIMVSYRCVPL